MNDYINQLKKDKKLDLSINKNLKFEFQIGSETIGKSNFIIAGPCSVESRDMIVEWGKSLKAAGVHALRGGAYKPCTYPVKKSLKGGWKEGLRDKGLQYLIEARDETGLPIVSEIMDASQINELSMEAIDVIQVGTRNFQNYTLLDALGKLDKPILLKRGTWGTIDEILGACERILYNGNNKLLICLRGVIGMPSYRHVFPSIRWAPDIMMIPALKELTNIPIIYDPSHATGYRNFVSSISKAAIVAGADGLAIECHPDPKNSISDPDQAISIEELGIILNFVKKSYN